jgi:endonuclease/exonuclease/phosphatase family metal-dependent hydrolase
VKLRATNQQFIVRQRTKTHPKEPHQLIQISKHSRRTFRNIVYSYASTLHDGTDEGVGLLSRYPVLETTPYRFAKFATDKDVVNRTCLRALIDTPRGKINFFVAHLSFEKSQQCRQVVELKVIFLFIIRRRKKNVLFYYPVFFFVFFL